MRIGPILRFITSSFQMNWINEVSLSYSALCPIFFISLSDF